MKSIHKFFVIAIACLLVLGAVCLAFGILLGGSVTSVLMAVISKAADTLGILFGWAPLVS